MWCVVNVLESGLFRSGTFNVGYIAREELQWLGGVDMGLPNWDVVLRLA